MSPDPLPQPRVAFLAEDFEHGRILAAFVAPADRSDDLPVVVLDEQLVELWARLQGAVVIAEDAKRIRDALVPRGFVEFQPIELREFSSLFGGSAGRSLASAEFELRAAWVADRIEWLTERGKPFNRRLEDWAVEGWPSLVPLFDCISELAADASAAPARGRSDRSPANRQRSQSTDSQDLGTALDCVFSNDGGLAEVISAYEQRPGQIQMARAVAETLTGEGVLLVEAGTGIGKSLAYLVPAALWCREAGRPVVVSTFTKGLQEQLVEKDIPLASKAVEACGGSAVSSIALKGRSNYLCLRRWMNERDQRRGDPAMASLKIKIAIWLETTATGDRAELELTAAEDRAFGLLSASTDNCLQTVCRSSMGNRCFFNRSRLEAQKADIVVLNHALLLASLDDENTVLANVDRFIVDEAHHLEAVATDRYSFVVSRPRLEALLLDFAALHGTSIVGHCGRAVEALSSSGALSSKPANARKALEVLRGSVTAVERGVEWAGRLFEAAGLLVEDLDDSTPYSVTRRILDSTRDQPNWQPLYAAWESLEAVFADVLQASRWLLGELDAAVGQGDASEKLEQALLDLSSWRREVEDLAQRLRSFVDQPEPGYVYWISGRRSSTDGALHGAPLEIADLVQQELFARASSVVLASATLRTQGSFHLMREQLGIHEADELVLPSPFDYEASTLLYIGRDVPDPRHAEYLDAVGAAIESLATALDGRTLALFTSHAAIRAVAPTLRSRLHDEGIQVLAQDLDGTPNQLVERLKREANTVVLGVAAFWEGVDVPGQELSGLVVTRLPFDVPSDPLFSARSERYDRPFQEFALPRAALKFRQGFGRLIRSESDRGVVVVLDSRIFTKSYGSTFIRALPPCTVHHGPIEDLGSVAKRWLRTTTAAR